MTNNVQLQSIFLSLRVLKPFINLRSAIDVLPKILMSINFALCFLHAVDIFTIIDFHFHIIGCEGCVGTPLKIYIFFDDC